MKIYADTKMKTIKLTYYILFFIGFTFFSCQSQNCNDLKISNQSYEVIINKVRTYDFAISEQFNTESVWIKKIEFYSCDSQKGYLIMTTKKGKSYIHQSVPVNIWNNFKNAESYGRFYNSYLKGKSQYRL